MRELNPFGIIIDAIDPREGTLEFSIDPGNIYEDKVERVLIFRFKVKDVIFTLERSGKYILRFIREGSPINKRVAEVNIKDFKGKGELIIALTWSKKGDAIYVSASKEYKLISGYSEE